VIEIRSSFELNGELSTQPYDRSVQPKIVFDDVARRFRKASDAEIELAIIAALNADER
jgi:hypothetical protein